MMINIEIYEICTTLFQSRMLAESDTLGGSGGYSISVKNIEDTDERKIGVQFTCPGPTEITTCDMTQPHHVIRMPKTSLPVSFVDVETSSPSPASTRFLLTFEGTKELKAAEEAALCHGKIHGFLMCIEHTEPQ